MHQVLSKLKSTKRKTTKRHNVLIALNKGIASARSIELAMLFSHAGFDVKTIFFDGTEEYVSAAAIKELTGHSPWTVSNKPGWTKADIRYVAGVYISSVPQPVSINNADGTTSDSLGNKVFTDYLLSQCDRLSFVVNDEASKSFKITSVNQQIVVLPDNLLKMNIIFESILAATTKYAAAKALYSAMSYTLQGDLSPIDYLDEIKKAFAEYGIEEEPAQNSDCQNSRIQLKNSEKQLDIILEQKPHDCSFPNALVVYIEKHKNGLLLTDKTATRLLPDFTSKSCYSRFVEYLMTELTRNQQ